MEWRMPSIPSTVKAAPHHWSRHCNGIMPAQRKSISTSKRRQELMLPSHQTNRLRKSRWNEKKAMTWLAVWLIAWDWFAKCPGQFNVCVIDKELLIHYISNLQLNSWSFLSFVWCSCGSQFGRCKVSPLVWTQWWWLCKNGQLVFSAFWPVSQYYHFFLDWSWHWEWWLADSIIVTGIYPKANGQNTPSAVLWWEPSRYGHPHG